MKYFRVEYDGLWLGGVSIVIAEDEAQAIEAVKADPQTCSPENIRAAEIPTGAFPQVLHNDNGDY